MRSFDTHTGSSDDMCSVCPTCVHTYVCTYVYNYLQMDIHVSQTDKFICVAWCSHICMYKWEVLTCAMAPQMTGIATNTHVNGSWHTYEWVVSRTYDASVTAHVTAHIWMCIDWLLRWRLEPLHICIHIPMHICIRVHIYAHVCSVMYTHVCMHGCVIVTCVLPPHICIHIHVCSVMYTHVCSTMLTHVCVYRKSLSHAHWLLRWQVWGGYGQ